MNAILLAAGLSSRMGENKLLLPWKNSTIVEKSLNNIIEANFNKVILVLGHEQEKIKHLINHQKLTIVQNKDFSVGQLSSIKSGLNHVQNSDFAILLADMPLITSSDLNDIIDYFYSFKSPSITRPVSKEDLPGHPVLFPANYKNEFQALDNLSKPNAMLKKHAQSVRAFKTSNKNYFIDIDTPQVYINLIKN